MEGNHRDNIKIGQKVAVVEKQNQRTAVTTDGVIAKILTKSKFHPHGIKVLLENGQVGRVKNIL